MARALRCSADATGSTFFGGHFTALSDGVRNVHEISMVDFSLGNIFVSLVMLCALERAMPSSEPKDSRLHLLAINPKAMTLDRDELEHW
jgi:hypothetical protein